MVKLFFYVSFLLIVVSYVYIIFKIRSLDATQHMYKKDKNNTNNNTNNNNINTKNNKEEVKGFKKYKEITYLTLVLGVIYFFLWTPSIIYYTILMVCEKCFPDNWDDSPPEKHIVYVIKFLSYLNAFFSPCVYCFCAKSLIRRLYARDFL